MEKKYYAVKNGRKIGVFDTWDECKAQTSGFKNAIFKSFKNKQEALDFINNTASDKIEDSHNEKSEDEILDNLEKDTMIAYIDGGYDDRIKYFSYAGIMFYNNTSEDFAFASCEEDLISMRNVSGEIKASMYVIQKAYDNNIKNVNIYYDYSGIELWADGSWKTNNHLTKSYRKFCIEMFKKVKVNFVKVKSHTNVKYNEYVDKLAKKALQDVKSTVN